MTKSIEPTLIERKIAELDDVDALIARRDAMREAERERSRLAAELIELERAETQNRQAALDAYREALAEYQEAQAAVFAMWRDDTVPTTYRRAADARSRLAAARSDVDTFAGVDPEPLPPRLMYVLARDVELRQAKKRWDDARKLDF